MNGATHWARRAAKCLVRFEFPVLSAVYLYYVIADGVPLFAFGLIALVWVARGWATGRLLHFTPLDLPIALILLWLPISLWVSTNGWLSLPKVYGVLLGVIFFYAVVTNIRSFQDAKSAAFWLCIVSAAIALAGLVGTDWAQGKILSLAFIYDRLPRIVQGIPRSIAGGFARNGVGGTLTLTIPFLAALLLRCPNNADRRPPTDHVSSRSIPVGRITYHREASPRDAPLTSGARPEQSRRVFLSSLISHLSSLFGRRSPPRSFSRSSRLRSRNPAEQFWGPPLVCRRSPSGESDAWRGFCLRRQLSSS